MQLVGIQIYNLNIARIKNNTKKWSTTTCFDPISGPSSGCDLTYRAAIQDVWGVFEGVGDWGVEGVTRYRCFNSRYHDLGLLQVDYH